MIKPPEYSALINPITCSAYAMRYVGRKDLAQGVLIATGDDPLLDRMSCILFDETVKAAADDAHMFIAPFVKVAIPVKASYAGELLVARLTVSVDGETVVDGELLERYLVAPPCQIAPQEKGQEPLVYVGREEGALLGCCRLHFLKDKSRIMMSLAGLPMGGGDIKFVSGAVLGHYTTKVRSGMLYDVGSLDAAGQAYPVTVPWWNDNSDRDSGLAPQLTRDAIEGASSDALRRALEERDMELCRLKEEADLRAKAEEKVRQLRRAQQEAEFKARAEEEEARIRRFAEDAALKAKAEAKAARAKEPEPFFASGGGPARIDIDETLDRAKRRLFRWGAIATLALLGAAFILIAALKYGGIR